jgi:hypothetical protein
LEDLRIAQEMNEENEREAEQLRLLKLEEQRIIELENQSARDLLFAK